MSGTNFLTSHIVKLPIATKDRVLASEHSCQALLTSLDPLAKQYAMRLAFAEETTAGILASWPLEDKESMSRHARAVAELADLGILRQANQAVSLHPAFARNVRTFLDRGWTSLWLHPPSDLDAYLPTLETVDKHARDCWESLLLFLAGNVELARAVAEETAPLPLEFSEAVDLEAILVELGLLSCEDASGGMRITEKGFDFLLRSTADQIWTILDVFLKTQYDLRAEEGAAAVNFLLQLGSCEVGRVCEMGKFEEWEVKATSALTQLGLLFPFKDAVGSLWVSPTPLSKLIVAPGNAEATPSATVAAGIPITNAADADGASSLSEGIVCETNYRVYAYTSSALQRSILQLFVAQEYILPNLFVGRLTRESCGQAFAVGISGEKIVEYLRRNAHAQALEQRKAAPVVPENIADAVRLWESESTRLSLEPAALYDNFESEELFRLTAERARELGACLWCDEGARRVAVRLEMYDEMRAFIKRIKAAMPSG